MTIGTNDGAKKEITMQASNSWVVKDPVLEAITKDEEDAILRGQLNSNSQGRGSQHRSNRSGGQEAVNRGVKDRFLIASRTGSVNLTGTTI